MTVRLVGISIVMAAGLLNAAYALPMRFNRVWKWENTWLVFTAWSLSIFPWVLAGALVKHLHELLTSLSVSNLAPALIFGLCLGIAQVMYGLAVDLVGVSVSMPVVSGLATVVGTFVPAFSRHSEVLHGRSGMVMGLSTLLLAAGLGFYWRAARMREGASGRSRSLRGLLLAVSTGILGGMMNVGFALSDQIVSRARLLGNSASVATFPVWAILCLAAFVPNLTFCLYVIEKNRTGTLFFRPGSKGDLLRSTFMGLFWILATTFYGVSTTFLGRTGTSVGYLFYGSFTIFFANILGWKVGEWSGAPSLALRRFWAAMGLVLASVATLGAAN